MDDNIICNSYRPLPAELYIGLSSIEGNGLFTTEFIEKGRELGISHVKNDSGNFHSNYIRTPLGGFINHNPDQPNCIAYECGEYLKMKTILDIQAGKELTMNYLLHEPCKNYMKDECKEELVVVSSEESGMEVIDVGETHLKKVIDEKLTYPQFVKKHYNK